MNISKRHITTRHYIADQNIAIQHSTPQYRTIQNTTEQYSAFLQASGKVPISALWHSAKPNTEGQAISVQETTINNRTEHFSAMQNSIRHLSEPKRQAQSTS